MFNYSLLYVFISPLGLIAYVSLQKPMKLGTKIAKSCMQCLLHCYTVDQ